MKQQTTHPTGRAQDFAVNETFFSTTDARGVIRSGNAVFERTSGYPLSELLGRPHNLIRHPDVPRSVFRLLWEEARAGREFIGYVKNHARNGNHYWVLAVVVPIPDGFLSVRIKPTSEILAAVERLYREMLLAEEAALTEQRSPTDAMAASTRILGRTMDSLGFSSYPAFGHHALITEIKRRDAELERCRLQLFPAALRDGPVAQAHYRRVRSAYRAACELFALLDSFAQVAREFRTHHGAMRRATEEFRIAALNSQIASHLLGNSGTVVGTVARFLDQYACELGRHVARLSESIEDAAGSVCEIASGLSVSRIMLEMYLLFLSESDTSLSDGRDLVRTRAMASDLTEAFQRTTRDAVAAIEKLRTHVPRVRAANAQVKQDVIRIQVAQISGMTEVARLAGAHEMQTLFAGLRALIDTANGELRTFLAIIDQLEALNSRAAAHTQVIEAELHGFEPRRPECPSPAVTAAGEEARVAAPTVAD